MSLHESLTRQKLPARTALSIDPRGRFISRGRDTSVDVYMNVYLALALGSRKRDQNPPLPRNPLPGSMHHTRETQYPETSSVSQSVMAGQSREKPWSRCLEKPPTPRWSEGGTCDVLLDCAYGPSIVAHADAPGNCSSDDDDDDDQREKGLLFSREEEDRGKVGLGFLMETSGSSRLIPAAAGDLAFQPM